MSQTYGITAHGEQRHAPHRDPVRYVVIIDAGGSTVAMLFQESRNLVAEFDAGAEAVSSMITGLAPAQGALGAEWALALGGHSSIERGAALVYALPI